MLSQMFQNNIIFLNVLTMFNDMDDGRESFGKPGRYTMQRQLNFQEATVEPQKTKVVLTDKQVNLPSSRWLRLHNCHPTIHGYQNR